MERSPGLAVAATLSSRLRASVAEQRHSNRYRSLETNSRPQGRLIEIDGRELVNFCSNDYLGLSSEPRVCAAAIDAINHYGFGSGAAALLSGRSEPHAELERQLAKFLERDRALLFSSGYLANLGVITALASRHDVVHQDKLNHASLIDAVKLSGAHNKRYRHRDYAALDRALAENTGRDQWVVSDGVFSMDGDLADLPVIAHSAAAHDATVICDDAHGFGVLAQGRGVCAHFGLRQSDIPIYIITFGKALGTAGAAVVGETALIEFLIQKSRTFVYDTAMPPAVAAATSRALSIIESEPQHHRRLQSNIELFRALATSAQISLCDSMTPIQPIIIGDEKRTIHAARLLSAAGFYIRAVRPPTVPVGTARLRICLSAAHDASDIQKLVATLDAVLGQTELRD